MLRLHESHGGRGTARPPRRRCQARTRATALEDRGPEVEFGRDGIVVEYRPFEIITLRVELGRR